MRFSMYKFKNASGFINYATRVACAACTFCILKVNLKMNPLSCRPHPVPLLAALPLSTPSVSINCALLTARELLRISHEKKRETRNEKKSLLPNLALMQYIDPKSKRQAEILIEIHSTINI